MGHGQLKISLTWMETPCLLGYGAPIYPRTVHWNCTASETDQPPHHRSPGGHWAHWHRRHGHWHWHGWHAIAGGLSSSRVEESLMCYHAMKRVVLLGQNASSITVSHIYGEPVRLHRFEVGTSRCQGWNTCAHRVQFSFRQACYMMLWTMIGTFIV